MSVMNRLVISGAENIESKYIKKVFKEFFCLSVEYFKDNKENVPVAPVTEPFQYDLVYEVVGNLKVLLGELAEIAKETNIVVILSIKESNKYESGIYYYHTMTNCLKRIKKMEETLARKMNEYTVGISLLLNVEGCVLNSHPRAILDEVLKIGALEQKIVEISRLNGYEAKLDNTNVLSLCKEIGVNKAHLYLLSHIVTMIRDM